MKTAEARLTELALRWEELQSQGSEVTPEELCSTCPELLEPLRKRIEEQRDRTYLSGFDSGATGTFAPVRDPESSDATRLPSDSTRLPSDSTHFPSDSHLFENPPVSALPEDYEILGELGHGGMGIVYRAFDKKRGEVVALKMIRWVDPTALRLFRKEFRAAADLTHPNLIALYELVSDGRLWFFTMELVEGVDFRTYVRYGPNGPPATPPAPPGSEEETNPAWRLEADQAERLRAALAQLVEGVSALHAAGSLHRDLKPSNVLVRRDGRLVVLDFGLVADLGPGGRHESTAGLVRGTVAYMSPEQAAGRPLTPASDWFTVGVMIYEALTRSRPTALPRAEDELIAGRDLFARPGSIVSGVPPDLDQLCMDLLRLEPERRPDGAEILRRVGRREAAAAVRPTTQTILVGRDSHLAFLNQRLDDLHRGRAAVVRVHGASGAGKSALVQRFLEALAGRDEVVVLSGRCYERESVPYKALDSLVEALENHLRRLHGVEVAALLPRDVLSLARVFPVLRRVDAVAAAPGRGFDVPDQQELRRRAFLALRELLARLADRKRLVLAIDDLQWGDVDSAAALAELLRGDDAPVILLLACHRDRDVASSPFLQAFLELERQGGTAFAWSDLPVEPLSAEQARELARSLLEADLQESGRLAEAVGRESGGNPFFVNELVRSLRDNASGDLVAGAGAGGELTLDGVLWSRVTRLPEPARRLLEVVAVSGRRMPESLALRAAGLALADERPTLSLLKADRFLRGAGLLDQEEVETYHDRVREAVVARLDGETLRGHHARLAHTLETSSDPDPEALATHFRGAGDPGRAADFYALGADRAAAALAFDRAAELYRLALELRPDAGAQGRALRRKLGDALANLGRGAEAAREYRAAVDGAPVAEAFELRRLAAMQLLISGHVDEGLAALREVLDSVGMSLAPTPFRTFLSLLAGRARLYLRGYDYRPRDPSEIAPADLARIDVCWAAVAGLSVVDFIRGADFQARGMLLALRSGETFRIARALTMEAVHASTGGTRSTKQVGRLLGIAEKAVNQVNDPYVLGMLDLARGTAEYLSGRWRPAVALCDRAEQTLRERCRGVAWELATTRSFALWGLSHLGEFTELSRRWPVLMQEARERGDLYELMNLSTYIMSVVGLASDDAGAARERLRETMPVWTNQGYHVQHNDAVWASAQVDLYLGQTADARSLLLGRWPALRRSMLLQVQFVRVMMRYLRARTALAAASREGAPAPLIAEARTYGRKLVGERAPWASGLSLLVEASARSLQGDQDGSAATLRQASAELDAVEMAAHAAAARRRLGEILGGEEGAALVVEADALLRARGVANPERLTATYAPGFFRAT
ncbi:MAG: AAA family ATPase [Isosphaeraceae bacterium]